MSEMSDSAIKLFVGASLDEAQDISQWAADIQEEYRRYLRVRGLEPLTDPEPGPQAKFVQAEILEELAALEKSVTPRTDQTPQDPRTAIGAHLDAIAERATAIAERQEWEKGEAEWMKILTEEEEREAAELKAEQERPPEELLNFIQSYIQS